MCYHVYVIGAHKRTHVGLLETCPTTVLLSTMSECVYVCGKQWGWLLLGILHKMWCRPVCSPGSWSGRGWLPLILVWHRIVVGLSCSYCKVQLIGTRCFLLVCYINLYQPTKLTNGVHTYKMEVKVSGISKMDLKRQRTRMANVYYAVSMVQFVGFCNTWCEFVVVCIWNDV